MKDENRPGEEIRQHVHSLMRQMEANRHSIAALESNYLVSIADRHLIQVPDMITPESPGNQTNWGQWIQSEDTWEFSLTTEARRELCLAIRADAESVLKYCARGSRPSSPALLA
jgi:hypothetical protein